jgi:hypothetical protein
VETGGRGTAWKEKVVAEEKQPLLDEVLFGARLARKTDPEQDLAEVLSLWFRQYQALPAHGTKSNRPSSWPTDRRPG